eukprot:TRINITY_DN26427_c0_g1_i1.p1 TRINITY_DN26427_c0_g1~~TRINITY_DN26427_c0_g1_i1.p1  ORF type:complete len:943 (-),score=255.05 TRINITY_DN26427_c0_g1_i1:360-3188(-)
MKGKWNDGKAGKAMPQLQFGKDAGKSGGKGKDGGKNFGKNCGKGFGKTHSKGNVANAELVVTGCNHGTVKEIVRGGFKRTGSNHGRPVYNKCEKVDGQDVVIYFWDSRDGESTCGWWFGSKVGGDVVWAFNPQRDAQTPPMSGWKVPYEGDVDPSMIISINNLKNNQPAQPPQPSKPKEIGFETYIAVSGCSHSVVSSIVNGSFTKTGENHGKPVYTKREKTKDGMDVLLYYWHDPKSLSFCGWWFGPVVGGEQVWAFQPSRTVQTPPVSGWQVPYDGPVDETFVIAADRKAAMEVKRQKQEAEAKKQAEEKRAAGAIRMVLQKLKTATSEDLSQCEEALEAAVKKDLEGCGAEKAKVQMECNNVLKQAKERVAKVRETQEKAAAKAKEAQEKAAPLVKELDGMLETAESALEALQAKVTEKALADASNQVQACADFTKANGTVMTSDAAFLNLLKRTNDCKQLFRKIETQSKLDALTAKISKYDANNDGLLERAELKKYAKHEFKFDLPESTVNLIFSNLVPKGQKGVQKDDFQRLKVQVGVARERIIDAERRKRREARDREIEEMKTQLKAKVEEVAKEVAETEALAGKIKESMQALKPKAGGEPVKATETVEKLDEIEEQVKGAKDKVVNLRKAIPQIKQDVDKDVTSWLSGELRPLSGKLKKLDHSLGSSTNICKRTRLTVDKKAQAEVENTQRQALAVLRNHQIAKGLTSDALFEEIASPGDAEARVVQESDLLKFFAGQQPEKGDATEVPAPDDLRRIFSLWDEAGEGALSRERFAELLRKFMKVMKKTVLTDGVSIKESKVVRKLGEKEVLEVFGAPVAEAEVEVMRIKARAMDDGAEGWVTISGNQGTTYLQDGGGVFKVVKETLLTESFELEATSKDVTERKLKVGELVEVKTWMKKQEETGLVRMRCRAILDGSVGWATVVGNQGAVFLEVK